MRYLNKWDFSLAISYRSFFEQKLNSFIKIRERGQSSNEISESTKFGREKLIFSLFTQKQLGIHDGTKNRLNALSHQLLEKTSRVTNKIHTFFISNSFFNSASVLLTFSWIDLQMLLRCYLIHISIIILRQLFIYYMPRPRTISCLCDLFFILIIIFTMINHVISLIQTQFLKIN